MAIRGGITEIGWMTLLFQIINMVIIIGIVGAIFFILIKLPKQLKKNGDRLKRIEESLDEINKKIDTSNK